ncbi:MAG: DNA polymerase III subunit alpha [Pyrinomonadaceae bacterium]
MTEQYIELHARSAFSFLEGASVPEELIAAALKFEMPAMALLDRDGVYGSPRFHLAAKKNGIRAHIGAEITVQSPKMVQSPTSRVQSQKLKDREADVGHWTLDVGPASLDIGHWTLDIGQKHSSHQKETFSIPVLVRNRTGYQNLCRLITLMKLRVPKHAKPGECSVTAVELAEHAEGLICLTGANDGPLAFALNRGISASSNLDPGNGSRTRARKGTRLNDSTGFQEAQKIAEWLIRVFGEGNVYAELQRHFNREEESRNHAVIEIARRMKLPLLATNGVCHASPIRREVTDVFTCIRNHVRLETAGQLLALNSETHLKPATTMQQVFGDLPEAIHNTVELSSRLEFTLEDLGYQFPKYPVPSGETMTSFLEKRTKEGARLRYNGLNGAPRYEQARPQLERELALIEKLKLEGYFLIVWDVVEFCRREGILIQGRGSAANSAVCYSLGITAVDPIGMELLFERFLSEERGEWPDIDLDLPSGDQRERAIQYVYQRYGKLGAAMTANVITYRGRSAAREVGKALGFDDETLERLAALVQTWEWKDPKDTTERQFRDAGLDLRNPRIKKFFQLYGMVQDLPRHLGQHSGGMVICQGQLDSVVPLEPAAMPGRVVVQWDKEDCADLGLIKVDLLGLGMMAALEESIQLIRDVYEEDVDLAHLPQDDPDVYEALQKADTIGLFQVESRAQMSCLPRLRPQKFYDIVVQVAIIRPGPIVGNMVHPYLKRRQGREPVVYPHPLLEPVLKRTLGVPLFQEQLLKMAMICADFSGGEAEELRRAFGFKRSEARMKEVEIKLRRGMDRNRIPRKAQDEIVQSITSFALYGFPESHAASFALIAYASAYLRCHYLAAFTAALLNNQPMGFYQPFTIVKDAQRHGLEVRPVDVTCSDWLCTIERETGEGDRGRGTGVRGNELKEDTETRRHADPKWGFFLRLGLRYVKGLSEQSGKGIVRERLKRAFDSIDDLRNRVRELRKDEMRKLAAVGALNFIQEGPMSKVQRPKSKTKESPMSNVQRPMSENRREEQALDIGHWTLDKQKDIGRWTLDKGVNRRDALWQVERVTRPAGELYTDLHEMDGNSPLAPMTRPERMDADFRGTGLTIGRHPVAYHRAQLTKLGASRAIDMQQIQNGSAIKVGGWVIVRQRPGTAKGFVFLTMEDETGVANVIITPQLFDKYRLILVDHPFLLISGTMQNQDNVISIKAKRVKALSFNVTAAPSHDFH